MSGAMRGSVTTQKVTVDGQENPITVRVDDPLPITVSDTALIDAFGRTRVSTPFTIFDSKQISNSQDAIHWTEAETSGTGTLSTYHNDRASTCLTTSNNTAGTIVRQTKRRFNYQPGKSQLAFITFVLNAHADGLTKRVGYFDENNGIFLEQTSSESAEVIKLGLRSYVTGSAETSYVLKSAWNIDPMDGTGPSGYTLDFTKAQILMIDFEWLGVGRVRVGFVLNGIPYYVHEFVHANIIDSVYMSTPNLPIRYELANAGNGPGHEGPHSHGESGALEAICSCIMSEGGLEPSGVTRSASTGALTINANTVGTYYALVGLALVDKQSDVQIQNIGLSAITNDNYNWQIRLNPDVAGTFTYTNVASSVVSIALGNTTSNPSNSVVTNGIVIASGYGAQLTSVSIDKTNFLKLGTTVAGVSDKLVLCAAPLTANLDLAGSMTWRES